MRGMFGSYLSQWLDRPNRYSQMEVSAYLHKFADQSIPRKQQAIVKAFAKALEIIPRQLCDNAGFDATNILTQLRVEHRKGNIWAGVDFDNEGVRDNMKAFVWEPSLVKVNAIQAGVEASCLILSVDETISTGRIFFSLPVLTIFVENEPSQDPQGPQRGLPAGSAHRALRGRGRGMPRRWRFFRPHLGPTICKITMLAFFWRR